MHNLATAKRSPLSVSKSIEEIVSLTNPVAKRIATRNSQIDRGFVESVINQSIFSWEGRNPRPALDSAGNFQVTDLDLLSFMVPLVSRGAVIEIPKYRNRRKVVHKIGERKIGTSNFGNTTGLVSNKDVFSFSVKLFDRSIAVQDHATEDETLGAHRNYMLVDCDGHWYDGWNHISWNPNFEENKFLSEKGLWTGNCVHFKHYVHPNRRQSVFGAPYLLLKMLHFRLNDEASFYRSEIKRLEELGFSIPEDEKGKARKTYSEGESAKIKVGTMEMVFDGPAFRGWYSPVEDSVDGIVAAYRRQKYLTYTLKPMVQFVIRADEAAYYLYGEKESFIAPWIRSVFEEGFKLPKGRVSWNRLDLSGGTALRYRIKNITQEVSKA